MDAPRRSVCACACVEKKGIGSENQRWRPTAARTKRTGQETMGVKDNECVEPASTAANAGTYLYRLFETMTFAVTQTGGNIYGVIIIVPTPTQPVQEKC